MPGSTSAHWDRIYATRSPDQVSWYQPHLTTSLTLIARAAPRQDAAIIDVGAGQATLVDDLLDRGYTNITALDISLEAIERTKARLGARAGLVHWICGDITRVSLPVQTYDVWHDRAVFHFLTEAGQRREYVRRAADSVKPGGYVIVGVFGPEAPATCSGLPVMRYDAASMHAEFGRRFQLVDHLVEQHATPFGTTQQFIWCFCHLE